MGDARIPNKLLQELPLKGPLQHRRPGSLLVENVSIQDQEKKVEELFLPPPHGASPEARIGHHLITPVNCPHELVVVMNNLRFSDWVTSSRLILAYFYIHYGMN